MLCLEIYESLYKPVIDYDRKFFKGTLASVEYELKYLPIFLWFAMSNKTFNKQILLSLSLLFMNSTAQIGKNISKGHAFTI